MRAPQAALALGALLFAVAAAACSNIVGIGDLTPSGGASSGAASSSGGGGSTAPFLGTWAIATGSTVATCGNNGPQSAADSGQLTVTKGSSGDALVFTSTNGCILNGSVTSPGIASIAAGQSCTETSTTATITLQAQSGTFTLNSATTATVNLSGSLADVSNGQEVDCTFTESDSLTM